MPRIPSAMRLAFAFLPLVLSAQQFEVASVKPSASGLDGFRGSCHGIDSKVSAGDTASMVPLGRCVVTDARLSHLIFIAWSLPAIRLIKGAPDWVIAGSERFNVNAEAENPSTTTEQQLLTMLQNLLIERFQLHFPARIEMSRATPFSSERAGRI